MNIKAQGRIFVYWKNAMWNELLILSVLIAKSRKRDIEYIILNKLPINQLSQMSSENWMLQVTNLKREPEYQSNY